LKNVNSTHNPAAGTRAGRDETTDFVSGHWGERRIASKTPGLNFQREYEFEVRMFWAQEGENVSTV